MLNEIEIHIQPTPNPNALKFILNTPVLNEGKATFASPEEAANLQIAKDLFQLNGIRELHLFDNYITVTFHDDKNSSQLRDEICAVIKTRMPVNDVNFQSKPTVQSRPVFESPELQRIQEILDNTVRSYLQSDGGDLEIISYNEKVLTIRYQGACGSCPSSVYGTLNAIQSILQDEFDPDIVVELADSF